MNRPRHHPLCLLLLLLAGCSSVSDERPEPIRKSEYYLEHGVSAFADSDYVTATDFFNKALAHYRSIDNTNGVLLSRINLAETALAFGNFDAAIDNLSEAEKIASVAPYHSYRERLALLRAQAHWRKGEREQSLALLETLLPEFDERQRSNKRGDLLLIGATTLRTDIAFARQDDELAEARLWLERLTVMLRTAEEQTPLHEARMLRFEAQLAYHEGEQQEALEKLEQALQLYRDAAARPALAATLTEGARLEMEMGQWRSAEERLQRALYIRLWILDRLGSLESIELLQQVYETLGEEQKLEQMRSEAARIRAALKR